MGCKNWKNKLFLQIIIFFVILNLTFIGAFKISLNEITDEIENIDFEDQITPQGVYLGGIVEVYNTGSSGLLVLDAPCGNVIGGKFDGDLGMVLDGPVFCSGYNRWKIRWEDGLEGWSAEDWLREKDISPSTKFNIGNTVRVYNTGISGLIVRTDPPDLAYMGIIYDGTEGTVKDGPFYGVPKGKTGFYYFWKIDYGSIIGWCAEDWLEKVSVDLTVTSVNAPTSAKVGDYIAVSWTVKNQGDISSGSFYNRISLATTPYGTDISLGNYPMSSIAASSSSSDAQVPKIPDTMTPGYYYVTVFSDAFNDIDESNEDNNINKAPNQINITANYPPNQPTSLLQLKSDGITSIPEGGTTFEQIVVFNGIVKDPDGDNVRLEIELRQIGELFIGEPTSETISDFVPSGSEVSITRYGLVDGQYHWQYRAKDSNGATSSWVEFGTPENIDFVIAIGDTTPPAAITDLITSKPTIESITLTWTAPGDDENTGSATGYVVKYSTSGSITDSNWNSAIIYTQSWTPLSTGNTETHVVSGLNSNTQYWFAIKAYDEVPNYGAISNSPSGKTAALGDTTPPAAIINLVTSNPTVGSITLTWTAPGDDENTGSATGYVVKYSTSGPITASNWDSALTYDQSWIPLIAGSTETHVVSGLNSDTQYWFATKSYDEVPNYAGISNSPSGTTTSANNPPDQPSDVSQFESNGITIIPEGTTTNETIVVFKGIISDPDGDYVRFEIELRQIDESFIGEPTEETISDLVPSGTKVTITRFDLNNGEYHWQYRVKDIHGKTTNWVEYETSGIDPPDFKVYEEWTFAIITDFHIGRNYKEYQGEDYYLTERLKKSVKEIYDNKERFNIKFVMVLGDISENGKFNELFKAKKILDKGLKDLPYFPIIGNHDVHSDEWPNKWKNFNDLFNLGFFNDQFKLLGIEESECGFDDSYLVNYAFHYHGLNFVSLDFVIDGSYGVLYIETLEWLKSWLSKESSAILFSHHPLIEKELLAFGWGDIWALKREIEQEKWNKVVANFAGHVHGYYDPEHLLGFCPPININPHYMNANKIYEPTEYSIPGNFPVITTEAVMVGSNEQTAKGIIRIVKLMEGENINYNRLEGIFPALNPYVSGVVYPSFKDFKRYREIMFICYAFTKAAYRIQYEIKCEDEFGDISEPITYPNYFKSRHYFYHLIKIPYESEYDDFDINLTIYGWLDVDSPKENPDIIEHINKTIKLGNWVDFIEFSPANISITDPNGRIINSTSNEIPYSYYIEKDINEDGDLDKLIAISNPLNGNYLCQLIGIDQGTYSLISGLITQQEIIIFNATEIPISSNEYHEYTIFSWEALSQGKEGVNVKIDIDGDGIFEFNFTSDSELTYSEYIDATTEETPIINGYELFILLGSIIGVGFAIINLKKKTIKIF